MKYKFKIPVETSTHGKTTSLILTVELIFVKGLTDMGKKHKCYCLLSYAINKHITHINNSTYTKNQYYVRQTVWNVSRVPLIQNNSNSKEVMQSLKQRDKMMLFRPNFEFKSHWGKRHILPLRKGSSFTNSFIICFKFGNWKEGKYTFINLLNEEVYLIKHHH